MIRRRRVELLDTSILLELLEVPFESSKRVEVLKELDERARLGADLLVSVAAIVEAGDHVGRIDNGDARRRCAQRLADLIAATVDPKKPWSFQAMDWNEQLMRDILAPSSDRIPQLVDSIATQYLEMGDLLIVAEFERLRKNLDSRVVDVDVWTLDTSLRAVIDDIRRPSPPPRPYRP